MNDVVITEKKPWYQSKIIWFNVAVAALATLELSASMIQPYVAGNVYGYGLLLLTVGNAALRIITTQAITMGNQK